MNSRAGTLHRTPRKVGEEGVFGTKQKRPPLTFVNQGGD